MTTFRTFAALAGLLLVCTARSQWPCDSLLHASFTTSPPNGTAVAFTNTSYTAHPNGTTYTWIFGDGSQGTGVNATHQYANAGTYTACLFAVSENCFDSACATITVGGQANPCDALNANFHSNIQGLAGLFQPTMPSNTAGYHWTFGDGTGIDGMTAAHTYAHSGQYNVCLKTWTWNPQTQDTCFADHCQWITVQGDSLNPCNGINAGFQVTAQGHVASFNNGAPNNQWSYQWNFGDGTSAYGPNPVHTYAQPGQYHACLVVWGWNPMTQDTCVADHCEWVTIQGGSSPCDSTFTTSFTNTLQSGHAVFTGHASLPASGYYWSFGDGTTAMGPVAEHNYAPGQYTVCVYAWYAPQNSPDSCMAHYCHTLVVPGDSLNPCNGINAGFQVTAQGHVASFNNGAPNNQWSYQWNFGDGTSAYGPNPVHTYAQPGQYHACLVVWGWNPMTQDTCVADHCEWVTIQGDSLDPCNGINAGFQVTTQGHVAAFNNGVVNNQWTYHWNFGDGTSAYGPNPVHTYAQPGQYHACLVLWSWNPLTQDTCAADHCEWVTIQGDSLNPCDGINAGFQVTTQGQVAHFNNGAPNNQWSYQWNFGDGTSAYGPNPVHTYAQPGQYHACLIVWGWNPMTQDTCVADHCEWVTIQGGSSPCDSTFATYFTVALQGGHAVFTGHASHPAGGYLWNFGDGTWGSGAVTDHNYAPGQYTVCVQAWYNPLNSTDTCAAEFCHLLVVQGDSLNPCDGLNAGFQVTTQGHVADFHNSVSNGQWSYLWNFGDGTQGYGPDPVHTYAQPGQYHACLILFSWDPQTQDTCVADHCEWVTIQGDSTNHPCDGLNAGFQVTHQGHVASFHNAGGNDQVYYWWNFGDGTFGSGWNPTHTYAQSGQYTACVMAYAYNPETQDTCAVDHCEPVIITGDSIGNPCDELNAGFQVTLQGQVAHFNNAVVSNTVAYLWDFGDGDGGDGPNPEHVYPGPGQYQACLTVWTWNPQTQDTCFEHHCELVVITPEGVPCDSLWAPAFAWSGGDGLVSLWSTTNTGQWNSTMVWRANGVVIGDGPQVTYVPANNDPFTICLTVNLYNNDQQLVCSGTTCNNLSIPVITGINENTAGDGVSVYPQPFSDHLVVSSTDLSGPVRATLLDMAGRLVDDRQVNFQGPTTLDYGALPTGTYVLRLQGANIQHVVRVLKD